MLSVVLKVYTLFVLAGFGCVLGKLSVPNIDKCVHATLNNKLGKDVEGKKGRQLFLYFGDAAIESVNVFSEDDVRRVTALAKCTAGEDSALFEDRSGSMHHFHDGGSNVTYLTGLFQATFPELDRKIRAIGQKSIARAEWTGDLNQYGIRSVQYLSFYKPGLKAHRVSIKEKGERKKEDTAFIIFPDAESNKKAEEEKQRQRKSIYDPDADEVVKGYLLPMEPPSAVAFTAIIQLSDRAQFAGGEVLVAKQKHHRTTISLNDKKKKSEEEKDGSGNQEEEEATGGYDLDEDTHYDDPEEPDSQDNNNNDNDNNNLNNNDKSGNGEKYDPHHVEFARFDAEKTTISRFTPEIGNMLLVLGEHSRGLRPVLFGRRNALIIEYWAYADAPVGAKRPSLSEAQPLKVGSAHGEL